jgi:sugar phosphate isomerase/epimerase
MKLGLLTASLGERPVEEVIERAAAMGLDALELAAWPKPLSRPFTAAHVATGDSSERTRLKAVLAKHELELAALAYYDNPLHSDASERDRVHEHLRHVIELAGELGCPLVGTFIGRDLSETVSRNLKLAERIFPPFVELAAQRGVRLMIENCPMHGWHPDGYPANLAYSPELWEWLTEMGLWLNFDPSHLQPLGIDPVDALRTKVDKVVHVHAKDVVIEPRGRNHFSCYGRAVGRNDPWDTGLWSYRLPGDGQVDWVALLAVLRDGGFAGTIAIEHEDEQGPGNSESLLGEIERAARYLDGLMERRGPAASAVGTGGSDDG